MNFSKIKNIKTYIWIIFSYILLTFLINPFGEFPIGDDFYFKMQIDAFRNGEFTKSALIDPTFIGQGFIAYIWSLLFGSSFNSLKFLSILITILCTISLEKFFQTLNFNNYQKFLGFIISLYNPYIWFLGYSFNTEIYFFLFSIISINYIFKLSHNYSENYLHYTLISSLLAFSVRQYAVIFLIPIFYILYINKKINFKNLIKISTIFLAMVLMLLYPKYSNEEHIESRDPLSVIYISESLTRFKNLYEFIPYLGIFTFILIPNLIKNFKIRKLIFITIISIIVGLYFFNKNIFLIGNVFYIENIGAKSYTELKTSITNNTIFKLFSSILLVFSFFSSVVYLLEKFNIRQKISDTNIVWLILISTSLTISSISTKVIDRYFILFFILFSVFLISKLKILKLSFSIYFFIFSFIFFNFWYIYEAYGNVRIKWDLAQNIIEETNINPSKIFVSINYTKYTTYIAKSDYTGLKNYYELGNFKCYVQNYIIGEYNFLGKSILKVETYLNSKFNISNPQIEDFGYSESLKGKYNGDAKLYKEYEYPNLFYNLLGRTYGVRSFCRN